MVLYQGLSQSNTLHLQSDYQLIKLPLRVGSESQPFPLDDVVLVPESDIEHTFNTVALVRQVLSRIGKKRIGHFTGCLNKDLVSPLRGGH